MLHPLQFLSLLMSQWSLKLPARWLLNLALHYQSILPKDLNHQIHPDHRTSHIRLHSQWSRLRNQSQQRSHPMLQLNHRQGHRMPRNRLLSLPTSPSHRLHQSNQVKDLRKLQSNRQFNLPTHLSGHPYGLPILRLSHPSNQVQDLLMPQLSHLSSHLQDHPTLQWDRQWSHQWDQSILLRNPSHL